MKKFLLTVLAINLVFAAQVDSKNDDEIALETG